LVKKPIDVGLGPEPLINNVYHKRALMKYGYSAETFVTSLNFITKEFDRQFIPESLLGKLVNPLFVFLYCIFRYKCVYIYFNGGPLGATALLRYLEPFLFSIAGISVLVMPYGSDIQVMDRCPNLIFRHVMSKDYPGQRFRRHSVVGQIDRWSKGASHIIAGCEWVDYLFYWDTLMLAHFSIDTEHWSPELVSESRSSANGESNLRVLHAPNHKAIKGSIYFIRAVEELRLEGVSIELVMVEKISNSNLKELMKSVDVVADQLLMGWYAMFALEGMSLGKPVLCYLRDDLKRLYVDAGLVGEDEIPIINCSPSTVKETLRMLVNNRDKLHDIGMLGRMYVENHHSLKVIGRTFDRINRGLGLVPTGSARLQI
jgi:glycosyltransferase involved in cell wall biosynthesis